MKCTTLSIVLVMLLCCCGGTNKFFRKLTKEEHASVRAAQKKYGKMTDAYRVLIITTSGDMVVRLYNETPLHRDNFVAKVKQGFYDSLLFHRVIKNFMIQGGDPESKTAASEQMLGNGDAPGGRIPAEIRTNLGIYHKRGALAAARDDNPAKASSNCQFYLAQGVVFTNKGLDSAARKRGYKINDEQRNMYTSVGGIPHLDGNYTVYGELESGLNVLDKIAAVKTGPADRPLEDVRMHLFLLNEIKKK